MEFRRLLFRSNFGNRSQGFSPNDLTVDATWRYIRRAQTLSGRSVAMWGRGEPSGVKSLPVGASVDMKERRAQACGSRLQALGARSRSIALELVQWYARYQQRNTESLAARRSSRRFCQTTR